MTLEYINGKWWVGNEGYPPYQISIQRAISMLEKPHTIEHEELNYKYYVFL